jgi:tRNA 2-selenouridine synthase
MYEELEIIPFLHRASTVPVADVRTPDEFQKGHIPGAVNIPHFTSRVWEAVGICYKQKGREEAVKKGLEFVQPRLLGYINRAGELSRNREILLHCWRGGLRSAGLAWLLDLAGFSAAVLKGGYKNYRKYAGQLFEKSLKIIVLGGLTGSGKTDALKMLEAQGRQVIDLEELASHKGSAFGGIGQGRQPSNEQFENNLAAKILALDSSSAVWVEDESRKIGSNQLPDGFYRQIRSASVIVLQAEKDRRISRLIKDYAVYDPSDLEASVLKISKRLGGLNTRDALESLRLKDFARVAEIVLGYYDKTYTYGLSQRDPDKVYYFEPAEYEAETDGYSLIEFARGKGIPGV